MLDRVIETVARYRMFDPGQRVGVAVSGGADSVCLLHVLRHLGPRWDLHLSVLHVDHQLRGEESRQDAAFVARMAGEMGLPFHLHKAVLEAGDNLEQAARRARQAFFHSFLCEGGAQRVALGHTRSDQAETVLFRFLRGAGTAGLAGIRPVTPDGIVRPLLGVTRRQTECYLRDHGIPWREDSSNRSLEFDRNRIRHQLLPLLGRDWNPALEESLAEMADWALAEEAYWDAEIGRLAGLHLTRKPPAILLRTDTVASLPEAVARRLIRRAIEQAKGDLREIGFRHVEAVRHLATGEAGSGRLQIPGLDVMRSFGWIRLAPPGGQRSESDYRLRLSVPGRFCVPGSGSWLELEIDYPDSGYTGRVSDLDWDRLSGPLELRNWRPGDRFQSSGSDRPEKLKTLFQQARIPLWDRRDWPVITSGESIVWTRRFGASREFAANQGCRVLLRVRETDNVES